MWADLLGYYVCSQYYMHNYIFKVKSVEEVMKCVKMKHHHLCIIVKGKGCYVTMNKVKW